jgi:hypothetical protein
LLADGKSADIDTHDPKILIDGARIAVHEMNQEIIYTYGFNLDP